MSGHYQMTPFKYVPPDGARGEERRIQDVGGRYQKPFVAMRCIMYFWLDALREKVESCDGGKERFILCIATLFSRL
jgi:hypothetical protein